MRHPRDGRWPSHGLTLIQIATAFVDAPTPGVTDNQHNFERRIQDLRNHKSALKAIADTEPVRHYRARCYVVRPSFNTRIVP